MIFASSLLLLAWSPIVPLQQAPGVAKAPNREAMAETVDDVETLRVLLTRDLAKRFEESQQGAMRREWLRLQLLNPGQYRVEDPTADAAPAAQDEPEKAVDGDSDADAVPETPNTADNAVAAKVDSLAMRYQLQFDPGESLRMDTRLPGATSYTRSFYAPGVGAWIDTTLNLSVEAISDKSESKADGETAKDEWDAARAEAKRSVGKAAGEADPTQPAPNYRFDLSRTQVEKAITTAVDVLAKYGHRVRNLRDDESVVIALKLEAQNWSSNPTRNLYALALTQLDTRSAAVQLSTEITKTVILRAPRSLLDSFAAGDIDKDAFRKRLMITRY